MNQERWRKITGIFEAALKRDPASRAAFVAEACPGDDALRQEVEAMLSSHERAGGFIESPAMEVAARQRGSVRTTGQGIVCSQGCPEGAPSSSPGLPLWATLGSRAI